GFLLRSDQFLFFSGPQYALWECGHTCTQSHRCLRQVSLFFDIHPICLVQVQSTCTLFYCFVTDPKDFNCFTKTRIPAQLAAQVFAFFVAQTITSLIKFNSSYYNKFIDEDILIILTLSLQNIAFKQYYFSHIKIKENKYYKLFGSKYLTITNYFKEKEKNGYIS
ncbi:hypothetical protein RFI_15853, partial [Reticulomyxa filosa]